MEIDQNFEFVRTWDLHPSILGMSQLCYYYINPHKNLAPEGFEPSYVMMKTLCLNHLTIRPICISTPHLILPLSPPTAMQAGAVYLGMHTPNST